MRDKEWDSKLYKAHKAFDDFTEILWPQMWSEERLRKKQREYVQQMDPAGYSQEYLNDPMDSNEAYLRREWFIDMSDDDFESEKVVCAAADFAISTKDRNNRTSITVGGKDRENIVSILDQHVGRWDSTEIVEELFDVYNQWHPDIFWVEDGVIWKALWPVIRKEMQKRDQWINFMPKTPSKDKAARGRAMQRRMRGGGMRWPFEAHWFPGMREELLKFTPHSEATLDDQFDSCAWLMIGFEELSEVEDEDFEEPWEQEMRAADPRHQIGRNQTTGY